MIFKPEDKKQVLVAGIFVSTLLLIAMVFVFLIGDQNALFEKRLALHTKVANAKNLKVGAPVQLKGIKIGTVSSIDFEDVDTLKISFQVAAKYQTWIKKDSYISFKTMGVLGDRFIEILGGTEKSEPIQSGEELPMQKAPEMDQFISKGEDLLSEGGKLLGRLNTILETVETGRVHNILTNLDNSTKNTSELLKAIDPKKLGQTMASLDKASANFAEITERVKQGPGTAHSLIYDQTVHDDLQTLLGGAKRNKVLNYFIRESIQKAK